MNLRLDGRKSHSKKGFNRDQALTEYDQCYCALYVSEKVVRGEKTARSIFERGASAPECPKGKTLSKALSEFSLPVWRCRVCGYLCAWETPPETCPICKVKERDLRSSSKSYFSLPLTCSFPIDNTPA